MSSDNGAGWVFITAITTAVVTIAGERLYQRYKELTRENRRLKNELHEERQKQEQQSESE